MKANRKARVLGTGALFIAGLALACTMLPMPPMVVNVSAMDIAYFALVGYSNPARAAALRSPIADPYFAPINALFPLSASRRNCARDFGPGAKWHAHVKKTGAGNQ